MSSISIEKITSILEQLSESNVKSVKLAENELIPLKADPSYTLCLSQILMNNTSTAVQQIAAIEFKNTVKMNWSDQMQAGCEQIHGLIIANLLPMLFSKSGLIADYVNEGTLAIAKLEYPGRWESLPTDAIKFLCEDHSVNLRVFELLAGVTEKYPHRERSDILYTEILHLTSIIHEELLKYAMGYFDLLKNAQSPGDLQVYLQIFTQIFKILYNINWQDLSDYMIDNKDRWVEVLRGILDEDIAKKFANNDMGDLRSSYLGCKGEGINCCLLFANKFRDEFNDMINSFADSIWKICTESNSDSIEGDNVTVLALHYFKTFVESPNYIEFFSSRLEDMFKSLIVKNLVSGQIIFEMFDDEPEAFTETLIQNQGMEEKGKNCLNFVRSLSRFHTEGVYTIICTMIKEYIDNFVSQGQSDIETQIILLTLVTSAPVTVFNQLLGAAEVNMQEDIIMTTYNSIIKPQLEPLFQFFEQKNDHKNFDHLILHPALSCYYLQFILIYRAFLEPSELLDILKYSSYLLRHNHPSLVKMTLKTLFVILSMPEYSTENHLNAVRNQGNMSFYEKYYRNPKKLAKRPTRKTKLFKKSNVGDQLGEILENVYLYSKNCETLHSEAMQVLRIVFVILEDRLSDYRENICGMFDEFFKKISIGYTYQTIKNLIECANVFIFAMRNNKDNEEYVIKHLTAPLNASMNLQVNDISSLVLQLYSIILREYNNPPIQTIQILIETLTDVSNYNQGNISLYPSYSIFFEELIRRDINFLAQGESTKSLMTVCQKFIELRMDACFFQILNALFDSYSQDEFASKGWLQFVTEASVSIIQESAQNSSAQNQNQAVINLRPLYLKELYIFIFKYGLKYTFENLFNFMENIKQGIVAEILESDQFLVFVQSFVSRPQVCVITLGLSKLLFLDYEVLNGLNLQNAWNRGFNALVSNIYRRTMTHALSLKDQQELFSDSNQFRPSSLKLQDQVIKEHSGESGFYRLQNLDPHKDLIVENLIKECGDDIKFSINQLKQFFSSIGQNFDFSFLNDKLRSWLDTIQLCLPDDHN